MSFKNMEEALKLINEKYISLDTEEVRHNKKVFGDVLSKLTKIMKKEDELFDKLFQQPFYGGSIYDNLKVKKPDEFDIDLVLVLPTTCEAHASKCCGCLNVTPSNKPGFFWFKLEEGYFTRFDKYIKDGYVQTDRILSWLKSVIYRVLNKYSDLDLFEFSKDEHEPPSYYSESGPALVLRLKGAFGYLNVHLAPAFQFSSKFWPKNGYRENATSKEHFCIVPKKNKRMDPSERYWRASFQSQERELIKGKQFLKPALRLLKEMRNNMKFQISSYALKTIVLNELDNSTWNDSLADTFMILLEKYKVSLQNQKISYYWNKKLNLLEDINQNQLVGHYNEINSHLKSIKDNYKEDPTIVASVILKKYSQEYVDFKTEYGRRYQTESGNDTQQISAPGYGGLAAVAGVVGVAALVGMAFYRSRRDQD